MLWPSGARIKKNLKNCFKNASLTTHDMLWSIGITIPRAQPGRSLRGLKRSPSLSQAKVEEKDKIWDSFDLYVFH